MSRLITYSPKCSVILHKIVSRSSVAGDVAVSSRFSGSQSATIDLTPYLSEQGGVHTSKSISAPAGAFSIALTDKPFIKDGGIESLYGLIEPMDMVEIRIAREPHLYVGGLLPIVMRGFISDVTRNESMSADGRPSRQVIVNGQDWGKIWQIIQLKYYGNYAVGEGYIAGLNLFEKYGVGFETGMSASEFLQQVVDKIINVFLADFMPSKSGLPIAIKCEITAPSASVSVSGPQNQEGAIYNLLHSFLDIGAFNELFIEDREEGPVCVYRPTPFKDVALATASNPGGQYIQEQTIPPSHVKIKGEDATQITVSRSDDNVANWFWVTAPRFEMLHDGSLKLFALQGDMEKISIANYPNSAVKLYGLRVMEAATQQGLDSVKTAGGQKEAENAKESDGYAQWLNSRLDVLRLQNKDNVIFERGSIALKGNSDIRSGCYCILQRGSMSSESYVTNVGHQFVPFGAFTTLINVERGTNFSERIKRGSGLESPYLSEMT